LKVSIWDIFIFHLIRKIDLYMADILNFSTFGNKQTKKRATVSATKYFLIDKMLIVEIIVKRVKLKS